jgi:hypothetical protein
VQDTVRSHVRHGKSLTRSCSLARNRATSANFARANWLFSFQTTYEAAECMKKQQAFSGKLILLKDLKERIISRGFSYRKSTKWIVGSASCEDETGSFWSESCCINAGDNI